MEAGSRSVRSFDSAISSERGRRREAPARRSTRWVGAVVVGVSVGSVLLALLLVGMKWLAGFFDKGTAWRG
jgi:hypothetical protein